MDLREYLFRKRLSVSEFSRLIDHSRGHISKIVNGERVPGKLLAKSISDATNGEVTVEELMKGSGENNDR